MQADTTFGTTLIAIDNDRGAARTAHGGADQRPLPAPGGQAADQRAAYRADGGALQDVLAEEVAGAVELDELGAAGIAPVIDADAPDLAAIVAAVEAVMKRRK